MLSAFCANMYVFFRFIKEIGLTPRLQGQHMLRLFVFPESRAQFLKLLGQAGMLPELNVELGIGFGSTEIDFWSYASGLVDTVGSKEVLKTQKLDEAESGEAPLENTVATA